ncbi:hypothetical protein RJ640_007582 [Escallonia rubra]|uniref:CCHC-type domain-containing protein n=1 Tax=Escallonia rubra TaxID=112253 RepID=A0AA88UEW1_9ASTE|nr:hypothetical protein RJ640_007582 [Escallonia rubra]
MAAADLPSTEESDLLVRSTKKYKRRLPDSDANPSVNPTFNPSHLQQTDFPPLNPGSIADPSGIIDPIPQIKSSFVETLSKSSLYCGDEEDAETEMATIRAQASEMESRTPTLAALSDQWPRIRISPEEMKRLWSPWRRGLIVKLLGRTVGFRLLYQRMKSLWKLRGDFEAVDLGNDFYVVRFQTREDYAHVLLDGPWVILGHYLTVQKWKPQFRPHTEEITSTLAWVRFPELPIEYFDEEIMMRMGNTLGTAVKADKQTADSARGKFARVCIELNLSKPLIPKVWLNGHLQNVEYEGLYAVCFHCGKYGHKLESCPSLRKTPPDSDHAPIEEQDDGSSGMNLDTGSGLNPTHDPGTTIQEQAYGPWMIVQPRSRRNSWASRSSPSKYAQFGDSNPSSTGQNAKILPRNSGSRFNVLTTEELTEEVQVNKEGTQYANSLSAQLRISQIQEPHTNRGNQHSKGDRIKQIKNHQASKAKESNRLGGKAPQSTTSSKNTINTHITPVSTPLILTTSSQAHKNQLCAPFNPKPSQVSFPSSTAGMIFSANSIVPNPFEPKLNSINLSTPHALTHEPVNPSTGPLPEVASLPRPPDGNSEHIVSSSKENTLPFTHANGNLDNDGMDKSDANLEVAQGDSRWGQPPPSSNATFLRNLVELVKTHNPEIFVLMEVRVQGHRSEDILRRTGYNKVHCIETRGFSGGIWLFWRKDWIDVEILPSHNQVLNAVVKGNDREDWLFSAVYATPNRTTKSDLWNYLEEMTSNMQLPWLVAGDFNDIANSTEKWGGIPASRNRCSTFVNRINSCQLLDLGFQGPPFTWFRNRNGHCYLKERLDRGLCNRQWRLNFPEAFIKHLPRTHSDHCPILIDTKGETPPAHSLRPFRFEAAWLTHPDFNRLVKDNWIYEQQNVQGTICRFVESVKSWNFHHARGADGSRVMGFYKPMLEMAALEQLRITDNYIKTSVSGAPSG